MKLILYILISALLTFGSAYSQTWEFFNTDNSGILSNNINSLDVDIEGNIYVATYQGISILKNGNWINIRKEDILNSSGISQIKVLDSTIYFSQGQFDGIYKGTVNNWTLLIDNLNADKLEIVNHDYLLFSDYWNYLYSYQNNKLTILDTVKFISDILYRKNGEIWFGAIHDGYGLYKQGTGKIDLGEKYKYMEVWSLAEDKDDFLWINTRFSAGIIKFNVDSNSFEVYDKTNTDALKDVIVIYDIQIDSNNNIWLLTRNSLSIGGTLLKYNHKEWKEYNIQEQLPEYEFFSLNSFVIDKYNNIWISTKGNDIGLIKFNETTTSVETNEANQIKIYPNPVGDLLTFDLEDKQAKSYTITDIFGRELIKENSPLSGSNNIDIRALTSGTYFISFEFSNNETITTKFVKE